MRNTRIPLFILALTLIFGLIACGGEVPTPEPTETAVLPMAVSPTAIPSTEVPPTATAEPEPTAVSTANNFITFTDSVTGISVAYPDDWFTNGGGSFYSFSSNRELLESPDIGGEGALVMLIMMENTDMETIDPAEAIIIFAENFDSGGQGKIDENPIVASINGLPGATTSMSLTLDDGTDLVGTFSVVIGNSQSALIASMTLAETGDVYMPDFEAILNSIVINEPVSKNQTDDLIADGTIVYGKSVDGGITSNGRSLWTFSAASGDYIYVTVSPASDLDVILDIIDGSGESILPLGAIDDSFGEEITDIQIPADGQYFIAVSGFGDSSGDFQLTLSTSLDAPTGTDLPDGGISQWAGSAVASSEFSNDSWAAFQAEGAPDTFDCGDIATAWASANSNSVEWIELYYDVPVEVTEINIYQSYNPDQVVSVELITTDGEYVSIFEQTQVAEENCPYILSLAVESNFASDGVRITIDQSALDDWTEIDAVELIGLQIDGTSSRPSAPSADDTSVGESLDGVLWRIGGLSGYEDEPIGHLEGAAYDAERGRIYVTDSHNGIIVMNESGEEIDLFTTDSDFFSPGGIGLDAAGNISVTNKSFIDDRGRIVVFTPEGEPLHEYSSNGTGDGQFGILSPTALTVAADGTTYVFDSNKDEADEIIYRIQKFSADGTFQTIIPLDPDYLLSYSAPMAIDDDGFIYLAEWLNSTIIKMDGDGNVVDVISRGDDFYYASIYGMDVDAAGNIYVSLWDEPAILKLDQNGNELLSYGVEVENGEVPWVAGSFYWPNGLAVSPDGRTIYVTDWSGDYSYLTAVDMSQ